MMNKERKPILATRSQKPRGDQVVFPVNDDNPPIPDWYKLQAQLYGLSVLCSTSVIRRWDII